MSSHKLQTRRRAKGFTLIEALAALMLMAIVLPVAMQAITTSTRLGSHTQREAQAMDLADTRLAEFILTGDWEQGDAVGVFNASYGENAERYEWVLEVDDWNQTDFKQLTLYVTWQSTRGIQTVKLITVVNSEEA